MTDPTRRNSPRPSDASGTRTPGERPTSPQCWSRPEPLRPTHPRRCLPCRGEGCAAGQPSRRHSRPPLSRESCSDAPTGTSAFRRWWRATRPSSVAGDGNPDGRTVGGARPGHVGRCTFDRNGPELAFRMERDARPDRKRRMIGSKRWSAWAVAAAVVCFGASGGFGAGSARGTGLVR